MHLPDQGLRNISPAEWHSAEVDQSLKQRRRGLHWLVQVLCQSERHIETLKADTIFDADRHSMQWAALRRRQSVQCRCSILRKNR